MVLNEKILKVLTIYGREGHLGHVTWTILKYKLSFLFMRHHVKFGFDLAKYFRKGKSLKVWTSDGRRRKEAYSISSTLIMK